MMAQELGSLPFQFNCVQYGMNHASQAIYEDVVKVGMQQGPDWVALQEEIQGEPGEKPMTGGGGHDHSVSVTRSARLGVSVWTVEGVSV